MIDSKMLDGVRNAVGNEGDLKLLHLVWDDPKELQGGLGVAVSKLCVALKNIKGVQVSVVLPSRTSQTQLVSENDEQSTYLLDLNEEEMQQLRLGTGVDSPVVAQSSALAYTRDVLKVCLEGPEATKVDLIYAHDWMTAAAGLHLRQKLGIPMILHIHSTQVDRVGEHVRDAVFQHEMWAMQQADMVIAVSEYTRSVLVSHYGITIDKIRVVRNAGATQSLDKQRLHPNEYSNRNSVSREPVILFAGRLTSQKSPEVAVEIMSGVLSKVEGARGVLVGAGDKIQSLRELITFKGMGECIEVLGNVPQKNMGAVYASASVLIVPSISEPFGLVAVEAADAGVAVVLSDKCGAGELLKSCPNLPPYEIETWIDEVIKESYVNLHELGFGHSVECWDDEGLQGGLYGVRLGKVFFGESMFSRKTDASKIALVHLVEWLRSEGVVLLDTQWMTEHLRQFGGYEVPRDVYLDLLEEALGV